MNYKKRVLVLSIFIVGVLVGCSIASVAAIAPPPGSTTYRIYGYVKVSGTGAPISGATVKIYSDLEGYKASTTTGTDGYFNRYVTCLYVEQFRIEVIKSGYNTENRYKTVYGTSIYFGTVYMTPSAPPIPPTIGTPTHLRNSPYDATVSVSVVWHYSPYVSRTVWLEWEGSLYTMQYSSGLYTKTMTNLDYSESYDYRIKATEVWYDSGVGYNREATSWSSFYVVNPLTTIVFHEDCDDYSNWVYPLIDSYDDLRYPMKDPSNGNIGEGISGSDTYFYAYNIPAPPEEKHQGRAFSEEFTPFRLSSLAGFEVELSRPTASSAEKGSFYITLYDAINVPEAKPILYIKLEDESVTTTRLALTVGYYDEALNEYSLNIGNYYDTSWSDTVRIWFDQDTGLWIGHDFGGPIQMTEWTGLNPSRSVRYVTMQWTKYYNEPMPALWIHDINIIKYDDVDQVDLNKAIGLRSAPKGYDLRKPGTYDEVQFFPQNGEGKLKFWVSGDNDEPYWGTLSLDIRRIRLDNPNGNPAIRVWMNGELLPLHDLPEEYFESTNTVNYLQEWTVMVMPIANLVEIDVRGGDWSVNDIIALRGVWCLWMGCSSTVWQQFPSSGELVYYIPMGPETKLDLDWLGYYPLEVWIDNTHIITQATPSNDIAVGDFARNSLHKVRIVYQGTNPSEARIVTMHFHHFWMNIEVDWIVGYDPRGIFGVNFDGFETWWRSYTHGRIDCVVSDTGTPAYNTVGSELYYYPEEVAEMGLNYFSHTGSRNWFWTLYVPYAGYHASSGDTAVGGYQGWINYGTNNGWERGLLTVVGRYDKYGIPFPTTALESIMQHEWGHAAHVHEGYAASDQVQNGEPCTSWSCVFNDDHDNTLWWGIAICDFHWRQTWMSIKVLDQSGQWTGSLRSYWWGYDWWLF